MKAQRVHAASSSRSSAHQPLLLPARRVPFARHQQPAGLGCHGATSHATPRSQTCRAAASSRRQWTSSMQLRAMPSSSGGAVSTEAQWWRKDSDLWVEVHDTDGFQREVMGAEVPVVVDWYASWCSGCQRSYPEVCKVLRLNPDLKKAFKFVKICVDDLPKAFTRDQGVTALPRMSLYRPGQGRVLTWDVPLSRVKHLKQNLHFAIAHPAAALALDPNSFFIATGAAPTKDQAKEAEARRAAAVAELENKSGSLFERLRAVANGRPAPAAPPPPPAAAPLPQPVPAAAMTGVAAAAVAAGAWPGLAMPAVDLDKAAETYRTTCAQQFGQTYLLDRQMFLNRYGQEYGYGGRIDGLYPVEVGVRMVPLGPTQRQQHYLDYTGSSVYTQSQLRAVFQELACTMFGNPHAQNPSSELSSERIDEVRSMILKTFNADPAEWQLVFTRSATGALKMVGETFPWTPGSLFRYLRENHNSVLGVREYALAHGAAFQAVDEALVEEWLSAPPPTALESVDTLTSRHDHAPSLCTGITAAGECQVDWGLGSLDEEETPNGNGASAVAATTTSRPSTSSSGSGSDFEAPSVGAGAASNGDAGVTYSLMAFPAEDNFAGVKYPLSWAAAVKRRSTPDHKWMVLIDAAAYAPTQPLDLSQVAADFVDIAFYKMFGYPTGLGALLVRTEAVPLLRKVFWGGGSVALASSRENFHVLKCRPSDKLEDGTVSFLDIISLKHGFNMMNSLGGIMKIQAHVASLTEWTYDALTKLKHSNGAPMVQVFGKHTSPDRRKVQGGILNFELRSPKGEPMSYRSFEREASAAGFHLRTGAECNPGACYSYLGVSDAEVEQLAGVKEGCDDEVEFIKVQRPDDAPPAAVHSSDTLKLLSSSQRLALGHPAEVASKWVQVPLGSVRVSLGWFSTYEDVWALVDFIGRHYRDREAEQDREPVVIADVA